MAYDSESFPVVTTPASSRDNMIALRNHLAVVPTHLFDMAQWHCGAAACIGGWAENLFFNGVNTPEEVVAKTLGLTRRQGFLLFYPSGSIMANATNTDAVKVIDHYLATGEADWSVAR